MVLIETSRNDRRVDHAFAVVVHRRDFSLVGVLEQRLTIVFAHVDDVVGHFFHRQYDSHLLAKHRCLRLKKFNGHAHSPFEQDCLLLNFFAAISAASPEHLSLVTHATKFIISQAPLLDIDLARVGKYSFFDP